MSAIFFHGCARLMQLAVYVRVMKKDQLICDFCFIIGGCENSVQLFNFEFCCRTSNFNYIF